MLVNNIGVGVYQFIAVGPDTEVIIVYDGDDAGYPFAASEFGFDCEGCVEDSRNVAEKQTLPSMSVLVGDEGSGGCGVQ